MSLYRILVLLSLASNQIYCATDKLLPMTLWEEGTSEQDLAKWTAPSTQTWYSYMGHDTLLSHEGLLDIANAHYNWLTKQTGYKTYSGSCLVAVMQDPETKRTWASSMPRGQRRLAMLTRASQNGAAPLWWAQAKTFKPKDWLHVEDGVFYNYETSPDASTAGGRYPFGSIIATWGIQMGQLSDGEIELCTEPKRKPSCQSVATTLGVGFRSENQQNPQEQAAQPPPLPPPDNSEDEFSQGVTDEDLIAGCNPGSQGRRLAVRGRGLNRRGNNSCNPFNSLSTISASTMTLSLPASDYQLSTFLTTVVSSTPRSTNVPSTTVPSVALDPTSVSSTAGSPTITGLASEGATTTAATKSPVTPTSSPASSMVPTGAVTVQAGTSPVHVGVLTGTKLYTSVSRALETLCPSVTQTTSMTACTTDSAKIKNIEWMDGDFPTNDGELVVTVESSQYNVTSLRDAMIKTAALTAKNAATGKNCYHHGKKEKRSNDGMFVSWLPNLLTRGMFDPNPPDPHLLFCNTAGFAGVNYYGPGWRSQRSPGATDWIDAHWSFQKGPEGAFECELAMLAVDALDLLQPEFTIGDVGLGEAIDYICTEAESGH